MYPHDCKNVINCMSFVICCLSKDIKCVWEVFILFGHVFTKGKKLKNNDLKPRNYVIYFIQIKWVFKLIYLLPEI